MEERRRNLMARANPRLEEAGARRKWVRSKPVPWPASVLAPPKVKFSTEESLESLAKERCHWTGIKFRAFRIHDTA